MASTRFIDAYLDAARRAGVLKKRLTPAQKQIVRKVIKAGKQAGEPFTWNTGTRGIGTTALRNLVKNGWVTRLTNGQYALTQDVIDACSEIE